MTTDFDRRLTGVGLLIVKNGDQHLIQRAARFRFDATEMGGVTGLFGKYFAFKYTVGNGDGLRAGKPDDPDGADAGRSGQRYDGI